VRREHLEAWAEQTTASFAVRLFPGGHFYIERSQAEFLAALAADLEQAGMWGKGKFTAETQRR
jgi:medium-chain acyl-[acyl-carrier-protein] hydrolase